MIFFRTPNRKIITDCDREPSISSIVHGLNTTTETESHNYKIRFLNEPLGRLYCEKLHNNYEFESVDYWWEYNVD